MDSPVYQGIMLIAMMVAFIGLWAWAWSHKRKAAFREASLLPLEEDNGEIPDQAEHKD
ncbi:MAG: CcoQ/FixQ family Cbb3-type cytochrome c oxidase assembly chaperone [Xanthomonadales bacterium]|nr:cbb3-type cytochrome c oxidase subunit 3 [Xanthomonadales bacterium]NIX12992.1 CcoQ/FixQ family Cbb3-type cytochrome c oxidase assembly chaperone [Xanthomonadales bacterium]